VAAYAFAIFTGAFLLFQVQPLIGKYLLPWFGGAPGVWTTCLVFFQVLLLGGYLYAHLSTRLLKPREQVTLHLFLLVLALATLPIIPNDSWKPQTAADPTFRIIALLAVSLGLPYFVLSATAPLLQHWFSRTHPGVSPFRLYALSNAGSLLALLSYPTIVETVFRRSTQAYVWSAGLGLYAVACLFCAVKLWKSRVVNAESMPTLETIAAGKAKSGTQLRNGGGANSANQARATGKVGAQASACRKQGVSFRSWVSLAANAILSVCRLKPALRRLDSSQPTHGSKTLDRLLWLVFPACASVLLLAVTNKICQDVAVVTFLWVLPLSVYLLSFIICFDGPKWYGRLWFGPALAAALAVMGWMVAERASFSTPAQVLLYVAGLFVCCMVCHGEVYGLKPSPEHLTHFYLMIAAGGALGGLFVAVFAPRVFPDFFELHLGLLACGALFLVACARSWEAPMRPWAIGAWASGWVALAALGWLLWTGAHRYDSARVLRVRNFYGVFNVYRHEYADPRLSLVELVHGRIAHGMQFLHPSRVGQPTLYYSLGSGIDLAIRILPPGPRRIGIVGLGAGTLAAYGQPGDRLRFYEINPQIEQVARTYFTYLKNSPAVSDVVLGDGRLALEREPPQNFDLLALDAFNSDSIPIHLLTREAFAVYQRHLKTNGLIAVHISNASLNLEPVLARLAADLNYTARVVEQTDSDQSQGVLPSIWFLLSQNPSFADAPELRSAARSAMLGGSKAPLWTDDFSALFALLRWKELVGNAPAEHSQQVAGARSGTPNAGIAAQIAAFRETLKREPDSTVALNNLAFLLATAPEPSLRHGAEAVRYAEKACALTGHTNLATLATLAAAYAEAGRFNDAVTTAEKACKLAADASNPALLQHNVELLELYRRGRPFHQQPH
jgi:hypothetical protein